MAEEHFKAIVWVTTYSVWGGVLLSSGRMYVILIGMVHVIMAVLYEYIFLTRMDTRKDIARTKVRLQRYVDEANQIKLEIDRMKNKIFDVFSEKGFMTIEERLKALETQVEGRHYGRYKTLREEVEEMRKELEKIQRIIKNGDRYSRY